jgi:uncharacterized protein
MALVTSTQASLAQRLGSDVQMPINDSFNPISGLELLLQDMQDLLLTVPGERVYHPTYGCTLRNQIWENIDTAATKGANSIQSALNKFEPRISTLSVTATINRNTDLLIFQINFIILATNTPFNLIFPFRSGTALSFA